MANFNENEMLKLFDSVEDGLVDDSGNSVDVISKIFSYTDKRGFLLKLYIGVDEPWCDLSLNIAESMVIVSQINSFPRAELSSICLSYIKKVSCDVEKKTLRIHMNDKKLFVKVYFEPYIWIDLRKVEFEEDAYE